MGMAASQARFLGLTARKNNVEYEGQQVNQERTTLANQSANYYNQLLGMKVPTPPSTSDYTKTVYTFEDGNLSNQITSMIAKAGGEYIVSYNKSWVNPHTPVSAGTAVVTTDGTDYSIGNTKLRKIGDFTDFVNADTDSDSDIDIDDQDGTYNGTDKYLKSLTNEQRKNLLEEEAQHLTLLQNKYGANTNWYIRYVENTTTGEMEPMFYNADTVEGAEYNKNGISLSNIQAYKMGEAKETEEIKNVTARLQQDATGRYTNITLYPGASNEVTYALTTNTITDEAAYDDAMNQYEYDKHQYDQTITEINAKIEIVQAQDKNLELRLKQLDTEQDAIAQEMEAVKNVIDKNVETTFKTFG